jgi:hypothetical protein
MKNQTETESHKLWQKYFDKQIEITGKGNGNLACEFAIIHLEELIKYAKTFGDTTKSDITKYKKMIKELNNIV